MAQRCSGHARDEQIDDEDDGEQRPCRSGPDGHDPSIPTQMPPDRGPDVPSAMGRTNGSRSPDLTIVPLGSSRLVGQSPVPAATCNASRRAASKSGPHGPWAATTKGDCSTVSYVSGSITNDLAQSSTVARSRSKESRL